jgi:transcription initiation factor TFIIIB Brf1 subunit/transcription initiation factor TFIIB
MIKNIHEVKACPDCGSTDIKYDDKEDEVICNECGLIFEPMAPAAEKTFEKTHELKKTKKK